ncbi:MAG: hypothetical protein RIR26_2567 [Pseudomonadota bacterium]
MILSKASMSMEGKEDTKPLPPFLRQTHAIVFSAHSLTIEIYGKIQFRINFEPLCGGLHAHQDDK